MQEQLNNQQAPLTPEDLGQLAIMGDPNVMPAPEQDKIEAANAGHEAIARQTLSLEEIRERNANAPKMVTDASGNRVYPEELINSDDKPSVGGRV